MTIRKLDVFFRTHLTLDPPNRFNSATNCLFYLCQSLFGQNKYQSLQGKVTKVPKEEVPPEAFSYVNTLIKVVVFFLAIIPTLFGIVTRGLSFLDSDVDQAYTIAFLSQLTSFEQTPKLIEASFAFLRKKTEEERHKLLASFPISIITMFLSLEAHQSYTHAFLSKLTEESRLWALAQLPARIQCSFLSIPGNQAFSLKYLLTLKDSIYKALMPTLPLDLIQKYQEEKKEIAKKQALHRYLNEAIESLKKLDAKLKEKSPQLGPWLSEYASTSFYPFPFLFAEQLESIPKIKDRADPVQLNQFMDLRRTCSEQLAALGLSWDEKEIQKTTQATALRTLQSTFNVNIVFFKNLTARLENEDSVIISWLDQQKQDVNYSYPFYTQPRILILMQQITANAALQKFSDLVATCKTSLTHRKLEAYTTEKPTLEHAAMQPLEKAMDQLENIARLQTLIKEQSA